MRQLDDRVGHRRPGATGPTAQFPLTMAPCDNGTIDVSPVYAAPAELHDDVGLGPASQRPGATRIRPRTAPSSTRLRASVSPSESDLLG